MSAEIIPKSVDAALDKANPSNGDIRPGITVKDEVLKAADPHHTTKVNGVDANGILNKRKSRGSLVKASYAEADTSEDDQPLV